MRPDFSKTIHPIFLMTLELLRRIRQGKRVVVADERSRIVETLTGAERYLGQTEEWQITKFALCVWIDSQLEAAKWTGAKWWSENRLEAKFFREENPSKAFFQFASRACELPQKDAVEAFYLAVALGYRGFYADPNASDRAKTADELSIPRSIDGWCKFISKHLPLKQERPTLDESIVVAADSSPMADANLLPTFVMLTLILLTCVLSLSITFLG